MMAMRSLHSLRCARARALTQSRSLCSKSPGFGQPGYEYSKRMDKTGRPISPHVFIYRFPTIAMSSITVRI